MVRRRGTTFQHGKDPGFHRAHEDELKVRKILQICRQTAEEGLVGTPHVAIAAVEITAAAKAKADIAAAIEGEIKEDTRSKIERRREWDEG